MKHGFVIPYKAFAMIRHGQTVANEQGTAAGVIDTPLTALGRAQASAAKPILSRLTPRPSVIAHSSLCRARETAMLLNEELSLPLVEQSALGERDFGAWVGEPWAFVAAQLHARRDPPDGEQNKDFLARVANGIGFVLARYEQPLIVTHGGVFDALAELYGCRLEDVENCQLYLFEPQDKEHPFPWKISHCSLDEKATLVRTTVNIMVED